MQGVHHIAVFLGLVLDGLESRRLLLQQLRVDDLSADGGVRAHQRAFVALDAEVRVPHRDLQRDVALLPLRSAGREGSVDRKSADRQLVAAAGDDLRGHFVHELGRFLGHDGRHLEAARHRLRVVHLLEVGDGLIDRLEVLLHHLGTLALVGLLDGLLDLGDGLFRGQHTRDVEEAGLHDGVDTRPHAGLLGHLVGVDHVEAQLLVDDLLLHFLRQLVPHLVRPVHAVEQEHPTRLAVLQHVVALEERPLMAGQKLRLGDEVAGANHVGSKAQVRHGDRAGLLRVIDEVPLGVETGLFADDLDRVLVGAHRAVRAQSVEQAALHGIGLGGEAVVHGKRGVGHIVVDTHGEVVLGCRLLEIVVHRLDHGRGEFLGRQTIATAHHLGHGERQLARRLGLGQRRDHVLIHRLASAARLFRAIQNRDGLDRLGQRGHQMVHRERSEEAHLDHADLLALLGQHIHGLVHDLGAGSHDHDHALGIRRAHVVEQVIGTSHDLGELVHLRLHDGRGRVVVLVARLARLEEDVGVLRGAAQDGPVGRHGAGAMRVDQVVGDHGLDVVVGELFDLLHLVRGAEAIEEVDEGHARLQGRSLRNEGHVHDLLHRARADEPEAGRSHGHHVAVVAEDRQGVGGHGAGRDVPHRRGQLARDLEHGRDHEQQALRGREGRGQRASLKGAVGRGGGARLALHLDHGRDRAPDVGAARGRPVIGPLTHVRRRGDGVDGTDLVGLVRYVGSGLVAVNRDFLASHVVVLQGG